MLIRIRRTFRRWTWHGVTLGIILFVELAIIGTHAALFLVAIARAHSYRHFTALLLRWQSLTAGIIALGAAIIAALVVYYQTQNTTRLENERKNGESSARQAIVIFALPQLLSYARECAFRKQKSTQWSAGEGGGGIHIELLRIPPIPMEPVNAIPQLIALCTREDGRKYLDLSDKSEVNTPTSGFSL
jgi:hypothetical protein